MIRELNLLRLALPLTVPYKLAFGAVTQFDSILVQTTLDAGEGIGEATILSGYTDETIEAAWMRAKTFAGRLPGLAPDAAKALAASVLTDAPFTATAFITAIEMAESHPLLAIDAPAAVPLLAGINATDPAGIEREIETALRDGYHTLKIKVGFDVGKDLDRVKFIQRFNAGRARLRIDANQGYGREDGIRFARDVPPDGVELLEQPCAASDWDAAAQVAAASAVPLMLDESIYTETDIERAAKVGAAFVKLKLMKLGSLTRLAAALDRIRELGMRPVLGNGVASDIGCWQEACIARRHLDTAGEMNGFLRQRRPLVKTPLPVVGGALQLKPGWVPRLDDAWLKTVTLDRGVFSMNRQAAEPVP